jgi:hypothetical protein
MEVVCCLYRCLLLICALSKMCMYIYCVVTFMFALCVVHGILHLNARLFADGMWKFIVCRE